MKAICFSVAIAATTILVPSSAKAWGEYGHLTVCEVAYRNLTAPARSELNAILQSRSGGIVIRSRDGVEQRRYTSFNVGCLEEDARPRRHPKDHFLNVSRDLVAIEGAACPISDTSGDPLACIFDGLARDLEILGDQSKTNEDRAFALMAIGHWIGDLHQPLHISFADDAGGNGIPIRLQGKCGTSSYRVQNLHSMWDNCLLEAGLFQKVRNRQEYKPSWGKRTIAYRAADTLMTNTSLSDERQIVGGDFADWAAESYAITRAESTQYCQIDGDTCDPIPFEGEKRQFTQEYLEANKAIAEERVRLAAFHLAHILNRALDPSYTEPSANGTQPEA